MVLFGMQTQAQSNIQTMSSRTVFGAEASFLNPSFLKDTRGFQLNIGPFMGANLLIGNNFQSIGNVLDLVKNDTKSDGSANFEPIHALMGSLRPTNKVWMHTDLTLLHATFRIGKPEKAMNVGISIRQHISANFSLNDAFLKMLYQGNKQFAGQTVYFSPRISAISYTDMGVALSKTLKVGDFSLTPGVRLRYLLGNAAIYTKKADLSFYTQEHGEYIDLGGDLDASTGGIGFNDFDDLDMKNLTKDFGTGWALDLGVTAEYKNLSFSLASIDNGSIGFKKDNSWNISSSESVRWEGYDILAQYEGRENTEFLDKYEIDTIKQAFRTGIGSKLTLNANYGLKEDTDKKGRIFYKHNLGLSYIQGFANKYNASNSAYYAFYYQYVYKNKMSAGVNLNGYGSVTDMGFNVGARVVGLNLGIGTNNVFTLLNTKNGKQVSLFFMLGFAF